MKATTLRFLYKGLYALAIFSFLASAVLTVGASRTSAAPEPDKVGVCHANGNDTHIYIEVPPNEGGYPQGHFTEEGNPDNGHEQDYLANSKEDCDSATSTPASPNQTVNTATPSDTPTPANAATASVTPTNTAIITATLTPTLTPTNIPTNTPTNTNTPTPSYASSILDPGTSLCSFFTFTISNISDEGAVIPKLSWLVQPGGASGTIKLFDVAAVLNFGPASPGTYQLYIWIGNHDSIDNADVTEQVIVPDNCGGTDPGDPEDLIPRINSRAKIIKRFRSTVATLRARTNSRAKTINGLRSTPSQLQASSSP